MKGSAYLGWKHGLPERFWPVTLDNFFENPDEIRELGLHVLELDEATKSSDEGGRWPGYRSEHLYLIDENLNHSILQKIFSCYFNLDVEQIFWESAFMKFHSTPSIDKDKNNIKNKGWIHRDGIDPRTDHYPRPEGTSDTEFSQLAGLIYLTPDIEPGTGTSLFNIKKDKTLLDWDETVETRLPLYKGDPISDEEVKKAWERHRRCFIEKVRFENIYNRLIMYDTKEWHGANSYYTSEDKDDRLTLAFFIGGIKANKWPLERVRNIERY